MLANLLFGILLAGAAVALAFLIVFALSETLRDD